MNLLIHSIDTNASIPNSFAVSGLSDAYVACPGSDVGTVSITKI